MAPRRTFIDLVEDDVPDSTSSSDQEAIFRRVRNFNPNEAIHIPIIDLTEVEDDELQAEVAKSIDLESESSPFQRYGPSDLRNPAVGFSPCLHSKEFRGMVLKPGSFVEISSISKLFNSQFLLIQNIIQRDQTVLRGIPFTRTRNLEGRLPRCRNELCMVLEIDSKDPRSDEVQSAIEIPLRNVLKARELRQTNADFPAHRYDKDMYNDNSVRIYSEAPLCCRWKFRVVYENLQAKIKPASEFELSRLTFKDIVNGMYRVSDQYTFHKWRGGKFRGGAYSNLTPDGALHRDLARYPVERRERASSSTRFSQQYSFGDIFGGAGGASRGAEAAGLRVMLGCDNNKHAMATYELNFPEAKTALMDVFDFLQDNTCIRVDILHISPPCQFWSPAHTRPGVNDEANIAVLFSCGELVKTIKPRAFTLEQTFGILRPAFKSYFHALVNGFTAIGYSVRWKVVSLDQWGLPQTRKRLIMIGSCPGEPLPTFPRPTHSRNQARRTQPSVTVENTLAQIPPGYTDMLHKPSSMSRVEKEPWDASRPLPCTITCSGSGSTYHPSGKRNFTPRELSLLQGFPLNHMFAGPESVRQIGNAFGSCAAEVLFRHIRRSLELADGLPIPEREDYVLAIPTGVDEMIDGPYNDYVEVGNTYSNGNISDADSATLDGSQDFDVIELDEFDPRGFPEASQRRPMFNSRAHIGPEDIVAGGRYGADPRPESPPLFTRAHRLRLGTKRNPFEIQDD